LRKQFGVKDATINTGIFQPKGHDSVWLFVTEQKTPDRIQYVDKLDGDVLRWEGQLSARKDPIIIKHDTLGLELLVFYRESRHEYQGAGFRYEGPFRYLSHEASHPTRFILRRVGTAPA
jgi:hypothetical protein